MIRTAPGGVGQRYSTMTITMNADSSLALFAAGYDLDSNFTGNVVVDWDTLGASNGLSNFTPLSSASLLYKPTLVGSDRIEVVYPNGDFRDTTGLISVVPGILSRVAIERSRFGQGGELGDTTITADDSVKIYARGYDAAGNHRGLVAGNWSLSGAIGSLTQTASADSTVLYPTRAGSASITMSAGGFTDATGLITVVPGDPDSLREVVATPDTVTPTQKLELKVQLVDQQDNAVADSVIHFVIIHGNGTLSALRDTTDLLGYASVSFTAPTGSGTTLINAYLSTLSNDTAKFTVVTVPSTLAYYAINPSTFSDTAGAGITVTISAFDIFNNPLDDDTTQTRVDVIGSSTGLNGSGVGIMPSFNTLTNGQHITVVVDSVKERIQIRVTSRFDSTKSATTGLITIRAAAPSTAAHYPDSLSTVQSGQLGLPLLDSSAVIIRDQFGNTVNDTVTVRYVATSNGSANPAIRLTDTAGIARTRWTLRTISSSTDTLLAIVPVLDDTVRFIANVLATGVDSLEFVTGLATTDTVNGTMSDTLAVRVMDNLGNPRPNVRITFSVMGFPSGADSTGFVRIPGTFVLSHDTLTDASGFARARFHLGTKVGTYIVRASNPALLNPAVFDTVQSTHDRPYSLLVVSGSGQTVTVGQVSDSLKVRVLDQYANTVLDTTRIVWETIHNALPAPPTWGLVDAVDPGVGGVPVFDAAGIDSAVTDPGSGLGKALWQARTVFGFDTLRAYLRGLDTVQFVLTVPAAAAAEVLPWSGDSATGIADGSILTLKSLVEDAFDNTVAGSMVRYTVVAGSASFVGADSSLTDESGISTVLLQLRDGDSTRIKASVTGATDTSFVLYNLVYVDSSLVPNRVRRDTVIHFSVNLRNYGPRPIALDTNQSYITFTDGVKAYQASLTFGSAVIPGRSSDSLVFRNDTVDVSILGNSYTPKVAIRGKTTGVPDSISGFLETRPNELQILGVDVEYTQAPAPRVFSKGDTIVVTLRVRNTSSVPMTNSDYGIQPSATGVFQTLSGISGTPIPADGATDFPVTLRILPSSPSGVIYLNGFYVGTAGGFSFSDTTAAFQDSIIVQSNASVSYLAGSLTPSQVSETQSAIFRVTVRNDSSAAVVLNPATSYVRFGTDSAFLLASQVVSPGGATTSLVFDTIATTITSGTYQGVIVLHGTENGGLFDTTLYTNTDSLRMQTAVNLARLTVDSIHVLSDTVSQNSDSITVVVKVRNTAEASATVDTLRLLYSAGGSAANGFVTAASTELLPWVLAGGTSHYFTFKTNVTATADTGQIVFDARVVARDANSGMIVTVPGAVVADSLVVLSRARLYITSVTTPTVDTVSLGQAGIPIQVTVSNLGGTAARLNALNMIFKLGLYDTTLVEVLPDTLDAFSSTVFHFTANVRSNSAIGLDSLGALADGIDLLSNKATTSTRTGLDTLRILSPTLLTLSSVQTDPLTISQGQDSVEVRVVVRNLGSSVGQIDTVRLKFWHESAANFAVGYTTSPYSDLSDTISSFGTKTFRFKVSAAANADTGRIWTDAVLEGRNQVSGAILYDSSATTIDLWTVQIPTGLIVSYVDVGRDSVTLGQSNVPISVRIRNQGGASGSVDSVRLVFAYGGAPNTTSFVTTQTAPIGLVTLGGNDSVLYSFAANVNPAAQTGMATVFAHVFGRDQNSLRTSVDSSRSISDSLNVQTRPVVTYVSNTLTPDTINNGSTVSFNVTVTNTGGALLLLDPSTVLVLLDVDSLKVNLRDTVFVASGQTRQLSFNSTIVSLRVDSVYYPILRLRGTENGNTFNDVLQSFDDSVKVLRNSVAQADSFFVYRTDGTLTGSVADNDSFIVRLRVHNTGGAALKNIVPVPVNPTASGSTIPALYSGPIPATFTLSAGDSANFEWRYRADSSGSVNFSVRVQGQDATTDSIILSNTATTFLTVTPPRADTLYHASPATDTLSVYSFTDLSVVVKDRSGTTAKSDSVLFSRISGDGGFADTSRAVSSVTAYTNNDGVATVRLFTSTVPATNVIRARLLSTTDDSLQFEMVTQPRAISSLQIVTSSDWTAGVDTPVTVTARDQFANVTTNASATITLSTIGSTTTRFVPATGQLALTNGVAEFRGIDSTARSVLQVKASASGVGTQALSQDITVHHSAAQHFADSLLMLNAKIGNLRTLSARVFDRFSNPVKDTIVVFTVIDSGNGGMFISSNLVPTDANGIASVQYQAGNDVRYNVIAAHGLTPAAIPGFPDSTTFIIDVDSIDADAAFVDGSLSPREVSRNQTVAFSARFRNGGTFPITLVADSSYIRFHNTVSGLTYTSKLDTSTRSLAPEGETQLLFRTAAVNIDTGIYPSGTDSAFILLYGTVFDSASSSLDTLIFAFTSDKLTDTLVVRTPSDIVVDSVNVLKLAVVRGQDSLQVSYRVTNRGGVIARNFAVVDSFGNGAQNVSGDWVLVSSQKPGSLAPYGTVVFTQTYRLSTTAKLGMDYVTTRISGVDSLDPLQVTRDTLYAFDSVQVFRAAQLLASSDSFRVYRGGLALGDNQKLLAGDVFELRMKLRNDSGSVVRNVSLNTLVIDTSGGTGRVDVLSGPVVERTSLGSPDSTRIVWQMRARDAGLGTLNFVARAEGQDSTNDDEAVLSNTVTRQVTITNALSDTVLAVTPLIDTVLVRNSSVMSVEVRDEFGNTVTGDSVRFTVESGSGGFNDTSRVTVDTVVVTGVDGRAVMRLYTSTAPVTNVVKAKLVSTVDDSVLFTVVSEPRAISKLQMAVATNWVAGDSQTVVVTAYDQYSNVTSNARDSVALTQLVADPTLVVVPGPVAGLSMGVATFRVVDTRARVFMQLQARAQEALTQVTSQSLNVHHNVAYRLVDSVVVDSNVAFGNVVTLVTKVIDQYSNPVQDTVVRFTVVHPSGNGAVLGGVDTTDVQGVASVLYQTGDSVGTNLVVATLNAVMSGTPDTTYFTIVTDSISANAKYVDNSLQPNDVSRGQSVAFRARFRNDGSFPITLVADSSYIRFHNTVSGLTYTSKLDTSTRSLAPEGETQLLFRTAAVNIDTGIYPSGTDSAFILLYGTVFDSASSSLDTLIFAFTSDKLTDTLVVRTPSDIVVDSVNVLKLAVVRGQDSLQVSYRVTNRGGVIARNFAVVDSFGNGAQNVSGDWVLVSSQKPGSLAPYGTVVFTQTYRLSTTAKLGMDYVTTRISGVDSLDPLQVTRDTLYAFDSVQVFRAAQLLASSDSFRVYRNGEVVANSMIFAGDVFELRMKVVNDSGYVITNLAVDTLTADTTAGRLASIAAPVVHRSRLDAPDSTYVSWVMRAQEFAGIGPITFTARVEAMDSTNDNAPVVSNTVSRLITISNNLPDTLLAEDSPDTLTIPVRSSIPLMVTIRDQYGNVVPDTAVQFITMTDSGGFNASGLTKDTIVVSGADGKARVTFFAPQQIQTVPVTARLLSTTDDSVVFRIGVIPAPISYLTITVDTTWRAGLYNPVVVRAFDQYNNPAILDTSTIILSGLPATGSSFEPGSARLDSGVVGFMARDTLAQTNFKIQATVLSTQTQSVSAAIRVLNTNPYEFSEADSAFFNDIIVTKSRQLTATVVDTFQNPVDTVLVTLEVVDRMGTGHINDSVMVNRSTDVNGRVQVTYQTGQIEGDNLVRATVAGLQDTVWYRLRTLDPALTSRYRMESIDPDTVTRNQNSAFRLTVSNAGPFTIRFKEDSTLFRVVHPTLPDSYVVKLDTLTRSLRDSASSQLLFRSAAVALPSGFYDSSSATVQLRAVGSVLDTASGDFTDVRFVLNLSRDSLVVKTPASVFLDSVTIVQDTASLGQDNVMVQYYLRNTGQNTAVNLSVSNTFMNAGADVSSHFALVNTTIPANLDSGIHVYSRAFLVKTTAPLGRTTILTRMTGADQYDPTQLTGDSITTTTGIRDSILIISPASVQIARAYVDTTYRDGFINRGHSVRLKTQLKNLGEEATKVYMHFDRSSGGSFAHVNDSVFVIPYRDSTWIISSDFNVQPSTTPAQQVFRVVIDSMIRLNQGDTIRGASLPASEQTLIVQDSARLALDLFVNGLTADSMVVSDSADFRIFVRAIKQGEALLSGDSVKVILTLPSAAYEFPAFGQTRSVTVRVDEPTPVTVHAYDSTVQFGAIRAVFDYGDAGFPLDSNNHLKAVMTNASDSAFVQTRKVGFLAATRFDVTAPAGAMDDTVSTFQDFVIRARVNSVARLVNIRANLALPDSGFTTQDSLSRSLNVPGDSADVTWRISAKGLTVRDTFFVYFTGTDTTTDFQRIGNTLSLVMTAVRRPELTMEMQIVAPLGATDNILSTNQAFSLNAVVQNTGGSQVSGGQMTLTLPTGFPDPPEGLNRGFVVGTPLTWTLRAPSVAVFADILQSLIETADRDARHSERLAPIRDNRSFWKSLGRIKVGQDQFSSREDGVSARKPILTVDGDTPTLVVDAMALQGLLQVDMTGVPVDDNTNLPATVLNAFDTLTVTVVDSARYVSPEIVLSRATVSTGQVFTVRARFRQLSSLTDRRGSIELPAGYSLATDSLTKTISDIDTVVSWNVLAPAADVAGGQTTDQVRVRLTGRDINSNATMEAFTPYEDIILQTRAKLSMAVEIIEPVDATDRFVSKGQTFKVRTIVRNEGTAKAFGIGSMAFDSNTVSLNHRFQIVAFNADSTFDPATPDSVTTWLVTAPDTVVNHPLVFRFVRVPTDSNTLDDAFVINNSVRLSVSTEPKRLKVERVVTQIEETRRSTMLSGLVDSLLVLRLTNEDLSGSPLGNRILTQDFRFVIDQYNASSGRFEPTGFGTYVDSVFVSINGSSLVVGNDTIGPSNDTLEVRFDRHRGILEGSPGLAKVRPSSNDLSFGLATSIGSPDIVSFAVKIADLPAGGSNPVFRVRLVEIRAFDFDELGDPSLGFQALNVVDAAGRPIGDTNSVMTSPSLRVIDPEGAKSQKFYNHPNPFGSSLRPRTTFSIFATDNDLTIEIYTLAGNLVRTLRPAEFGAPPVPGNTYELMTWDGRNQKGQSVRNGVYIAVLKMAGSPKLKTKILIAR